MTTQNPVVLICDHPLVSGLLQQHLEAAGFTSALRASCDAQQLTDTGLAGVLIDLVLVQGNGFDLLRKLAQRLKCPLVLLTATGRQSDFAWGRNAGAAAVLAYPPDMGALVKAFNCGVADGHT